MQRIIKNQATFQTTFLTQTFHCRKQTKISKIGENYHNSREKLKMLGMRIPKNNKKQTKKASKESEISENYQDSCEKSKASNIEMLNSIDCSVETLNEVNVSLISAPYPATLETIRGESVESQRAGELVWDKLKKLLSNKPAVQRNENSGFRFFL